MKQSKKQLKTNKTDSLSDGDIEKIGNLLDNSLAPFARKKDLANLVTKDDLNEVKIELKDYIHQGVDTVMNGMDKLSEQLAEKERVDRIESWTKQIAERVGVVLS